MAILNNSDFITCIYKTKKLVTLELKRFVPIVPTQQQRGQYLKGPINSIIFSAWPNQTYSHIHSYWMLVCGYKVSANRIVSLSALANFQYTTTTNILITGLFCMLATLDRIRRNIESKLDLDLVR